MKRRVLFLCATDGVLSPMAEAFLQHIDSRNFEAFSASTSEQVHPLSVDVMKEVGIDLRQRVPKNFDELKDESFDFVITLGEPTLKQYFVRAGDSLQWKFENPLSVSNELEVQRRAFRSVRDQIAQRLRLFDIVQIRPSSLQKEPASPIPGRFELVDPPRSPEIY